MGSAIAQSKCLISCPSVSERNSFQCETVSLPQITPCVVRPKQCVCPGYHGHNRSAFDWWLGIWVRSYQVHLPVPKMQPTMFSYRRLFSSSASSQRSGRNKSLSSPHSRLLRQTAASHCPISVPSGKYVPLIVSPPFGADLIFIPNNGGYFDKIHISGLRLMVHGSLAESWFTYHTHALPYARSKVSQVLGLGIGYHWM